MTVDPTPDAVDTKTVDVVRSEERLRVSSRRVPVERVIVRRHLVTETRTVTVQVRREELHVERVPIANGSPALAAADAADTAPALVLVLSEEVPEVTMRVVPIERVRVFVDRITEQAPTDATLRREVVEVAEGASVRD